MENKQKNINEYLKQSANAITKKNVKTGASIVPKYLKAGITKDTRLKPMDINVLYLLHEYVNTETGHCYPTQQELANTLGYARPNISKALGRLEKACYIHRCPAKKPTRNGKFLETSDEIIITPFNKLNNNEYHNGLTAEIERIKYIVVDYNKDSSVRTIIATGADTQSFTRQEMIEIRETNRRKTDTETLQQLKKQEQPQQNNNEYIKVEEQEKKEMKYIPTNAEIEALEALRKQEAAKRHTQHNNTKPQQRAQQSYIEATDEEILALFKEQGFATDEEIDEYLTGQKQEQPKSHPKQNQEFDIDAWISQPYIFTGRGV